MRILAHFATMSQDSVPAPEVASGQGYGLLYSAYLHSAAWVLRKAVSFTSGAGTLFDKVVKVDTPSLGEGHVEVSICIPAASDGRRQGPLPLILVAEGGGFVLGGPKDGEHIVRAISDKVCTGMLLIAMSADKNVRSAQ